MDAKFHTIGHHWSGPDGVCPAICTSAEVIGRLPVGLNYFCQPYWVIDYEFTPHGRFRVRSVRAPWAPHRPFQVHLYPPEVPVWEDTRGEKGRRHSAWVTFSAGARTGLERFIHPARRYARFLDEGGECGILLRQAAQVGRKRGEDGFWAAQALLCRLIELLLTAEPVAQESWRIVPRTSVLAPHGLAARVERYLRAHLRENVPVAILARDLHVSVSTLTHRYPREAGESLIATRRRLRIGQAKLLLAKGPPLKAIAEQTGFRDAFYLSRTFAKVTGAAPRDFRRRLAAR